MGVFKRGLQVGLQLPQFEDDLKTMSVTMRHTIIVSHAVPAIRVRRLVPSSFFALDTLKIGGETCGIVQSVFAFNENLHYTPLPKPSIEFWSASFRVLTRAPLREDTGRAGAPGSRMIRTDPAAWLVRSYLGTKAAWAMQRAVAANAKSAEFNIIQRGDYNAVYIDVQPDDKSATTSIAVRAVADQNPALPFASWDKMAEFLTRRPNGYYDMAAIAGRENVGFIALDHPPMQPRNAELIPVGGEVRESRLGVWEQLGVMEPNEMRRPFSILIQPQLSVVIAPPKLLRQDAVAALAPTRQHVNP